MLYGGVTGVTWTPRRRHGEDSGNGDSERESGGEQGGSRASGDESALQETGPAQTDRQQGGQRRSSADVDGLLAEIVGMTTGGAGGDAVGEDGAQGRRHSGTDQQDDAQRDGRGGGTQGRSQDGAQLSPDDMKLILSHLVDLATQQQQANQQQGTLPPAMPLKYWKHLLRNYGSGGNGQAGGGQGQNNQGQRDDQQNQGTDVNTLLAHIVDLVTQQQRGGSEQQPGSGGHQQGGGRRGQQQRQQQQQQQRTLRVTYLKQQGASQVVDRLQHMRAQIWGVVHEYQRRMQLHGTAAVQAARRRQERAKWGRRYTLMVILAVFAGIGLFAWWWWYGFDFSLFGGGGAEEGGGDGY